MLFYSDDLQEFYRTPLGTRVINTLSPHLIHLLGDLKNKTFMGLGYPMPFMENLSPPYRSLYFMMNRMGAHHWGDQTHKNHILNQTALVKDKELPLGESTIDVALMVHCLEMSRAQDLTLEECYRVLKPNGRLVIVVPNRQGLWARYDSTPFGQGHPYTPYQLKASLRESGFTPLETRYCLFLAPKNRRLFRGFQEWMERKLQRYFPLIGGVIIIEASKEVYALRRRPSPKWAHQKAGV